jgi:hypothetical protein
MNSKIRKRYLAYTQHTYIIQCLIKKGKTLKHTEELLKTKKIPLGKLQQKQLTQNCYSLRSHVLRKPSITYKQPMNYVNTKKKWKKRESWKTKIERDYKIRYKK